MYEPKHFDPETEFMMEEENVYDKMDENLLRRLDQLRDLVMQPLIINSSYRSPEYNKKIGGSKGSKHMEGIAVDISCKNSTLRHKIVCKATSLGFTVGVTKTFIHLDIREIESPILFLY